MRLYSYVVEHDFGFAPNPFHGVCTLATCKPEIRLRAKVGDWVVGTSGVKSGEAGRLVYWMQVADILSFDNYWSDGRFRAKRPCLRGSVMRRYGDNIYHHDPVTGDYLQEDSFHSLEGGRLNAKNLDRDTDTTSNVLIGGEFSYWGGSGPRIPAGLADMIKKGPSHKCCFEKDRIDAFIAWLTSFPERGFVAEPALWRKGRVR